jgi:pullulanase
MSLQYKPLSLVALATTAVLYGCGSDDTIEKKYVYDGNTGLWCASPQIVQTVDADFHPLSTSEKAALKAAAKARDGASFDEAAFNVYSYDYAGIDLFAVLGLTLSEKGRQATAKAEAKAFKIAQGQKTIFGDNFDSWFNSWFASVPLTDYLGASERLNKATRGNQLNLTAANNSKEICYTPPAACPNYQIPDETGTFACLTPLDNPLADIQPGVSYMAPAGKAAIFYRSAQHINDGDNTAAYKDLTIHTWNDPDCTAYKDDSTTNWGQGKPATGIDPVYGMYWTLNLVDAPDQCGNVIVYNKVTGTKRVSEADLRLPLANAGVLANLDKMSYLQDGIKVNNYDGKLYANQHPLLGAAAGGTKACGWGLELDETGEVCVGQTLAAQCPTGTIAVGEGQEEIASKCIIEFNPAATTLYLRGGFNDWGTANKMKYANNKFRLNFSYGAHPQGATLNENGSVNYGFKIADADWAEASTFGAIKGGDSPAVGKEIALTAGNGVGQDMFIGLKANTIYQYVLNATNPGAVTLKINQVPLAVFPVMTIDGEMVDLEYSGAGKYSSRMTLSPDTYSISIADMDAGFAVGAGADAMLVLNQPHPLVAAGSALSLQVSQQNDYDFILDLSVADKPTLEVKPGKPLGNTAVFIRGSLNGWGAPASDEISFDAASRSYSVIYGLEASADAYHFKFASEDWSTVDLGYSAFDISADADAIALTEVGGNIAIKVDKSSSYLFKLDFNSAKPVLKVSELPIYIRGGMNGWGEDDQMEFNATDAGNSNEAGHVYVKTIPLTTDNVFFKVATADWSTINLGAPTDDGLAVEIGKEVSLAPTNGNLAIMPAVSGDYIFRFDLTKKTLVVTGPN